MADSADYAYTGVDKWLPESQERAAYELAHLQRTVAALELPAAVHERAVELLELVRDRGLLQNREFNAVLGAVIYVAGRELREPRTMDEIADVTGASKKDVGKAYRSIGRNTDIRIVPPDPVDYLPRFAARLQLGEPVREQAAAIIEAAEDVDGLLSGKAPTGTAAAALFVAAAMGGEERTMREVADLLDVTPVTIRERTQEFLEHLDLDPVPDRLRDVGDQ